MGYEGWLSVAGTEVINNDRVRAYTQHLLPTLTVNLGNDDESGQALRRLLADQPYRSPMLDDAPWVDPDDPDTFDFCGVLGLSAVGLSDSTRKATVVEHNQSGGGITGRRKATRSVRYSALLIGATTAAVEAGQAWLSAALEGDCDGDCNGSDVCYLSALVDPQDWGDRVSDPVSVSSLRTNGPKGTYDTGTGYWNPTSATQELRTPKVALPLPCDEIVWTWTISGVAGSQIAFRSYSENGLVFKDILTIDSDGEGTLSISDMGNGKTTAFSAIRLSIGDKVTVKKVTVEMRDNAVNSACFNHYQRQLFEASAIDGPTGVEDYSPSCGAMRRVEFTITTGIPWAFGTFDRLLAKSNGLNKVTHDQSAVVFKLDKTIVTKEQDFINRGVTPLKNPTFIRDPTCPVVPAPPRPTATFTDCKASTSFYATYGISIPGKEIPLWHEMVPRLLVSTGEQPARGVRVRFFPRPLGTMQDAIDLDPQSACGEFVIDYIPAHATFVLDGITEHCVIKRGGYKDSPANHLLSGLSSASLFQWPVLTCGTDYLCVIDVDGENQSVVGFWLYCVTRWG